MNDSSYVDKIHADADKIHAIDNLAFFLADLGIISFKLVDPIIGYQVQLDYIERMKR